MGLKSPVFHLQETLVSLTYCKQGKWNEAEVLLVEVLLVQVLLVEVLEAQTRLVGPGHPSTLSSMGRLAVTYGMQGKLSEAELLQVEVLAARKGVCDPEHPNTLNGMCC